MSGAMEFLTNFIDGKGREVDRANAVEQLSRLMTGQTGRSRMSRPRRVDTARTQPVTVPTPENTKDRQDKVNLLAGMVEAEIENGRVAK